MKNQPCLANWFLRRWNGLGLDLWTYSPYIRLYCTRVPLRSPVAPGLHVLLQAGQLARRGGAWQTSESRQMLEHAIDVGRGGIYLRLTPEQYRALRRRRSAPHPARRP